MSSQTDGEAETTDGQSDLELEDHTVETEVVSPAELRCGISLESDDTSE